MSTYIDIATEMFTNPRHFVKDFGSGNDEPGMHWLPGIIIETATLIVLYRVLFFGIFLRLLEKSVPSFDFWARLSPDVEKPIQGIFHPNAQREFLYCSILGLHHLAGGLLMALGVYYGDATIFAQGAIIDLVDAVHDSVLMALPAWPFEDRNPQLMTLLLPHHAFSVIINVPVLVLGLHQEQDAQKIGACLLLAGGVGLAVLLFCRTRDRTIQSHCFQEFIGWTFNMFMIYGCRFYIFPVSCYNIINDKWAGWSIGIRVAMVLVVLLMSFFNILITLDVNQKYFTGVVPRAFPSLFSKSKKNN